MQEDFQQGGFTLLDKLADYIRECDLVVGDGGVEVPEFVATKNETLQWSEFQNLGYNSIGISKPRSHHTLE